SRGNAETLDRKLYQFKPEPERRAEGEIPVTRGENPGRGNPRQTGFVPRHRAYAAVVATGGADNLAAHGRPYAGESRLGALFARRWTTSPNKHLRPGRQALRGAMRRRPPEMPAGNQPRS